MLKYKGYYYSKFLSEMAVSYIYMFTIGGGYKENGTVRKWVRAFRGECETGPDLNDIKKLYGENRRLRRELEEKKKETAFLKKAAAFFAKETG